MADDIKSGAPASSTGEGEITQTDLASQLRLKIRDAEWHEYGRLQLSDFIIAHKAEFEALVDRSAAPAPRPAFTEEEIARAIYEAETWKLYGEYVLWRDLGGPHRANAFKLARRVLSLLRDADRGQK